MVIQPDQHFNYGLTLAAEYAKRSEHSMYKMGAVIFRKNQVVSIGWNKNRTHPKAKNYTRKIHAELAALISSRIPRLTYIDTLKGTDMFVARLTKGGFLATSKPCRDCMVLIAEAGIETVTFIDEQGKICLMKL